MPFVKSKSPYNLYFGEGEGIEYLVWVDGLATIPNSSEGATPTTPTDGSSADSSEIEKLKVALAEANAKIKQLEGGKKPENDEEQHYKNIKAVSDEADE